MPTAALGFCATAGCSERVRRGHCARHQQAKRQLERRHYTGTGINYGRAWQRAAKRFLALHPWCMLCPPGERALATEVDHRIPHKGDAALFWSESNFQAVCKPCHSQKTAREVGWAG